MCVCVCLSIHIKLGEYYQQQLACLIGEEM